MNRKHCFWRWAERQRQPWPEQESRAELRLRESPVRQGFREREREQVCRQEECLLQVAAWFLRFPASPRSRVERREREFHLGLLEQELLVCLQRWLAAWLGPEQELLDHRGLQVRAQAGWLLQSHHFLQGREPEPPDQPPQECLALLEQAQVR